MGMNAVNQESVGDIFMDNVAALIRARRTIHDFLPDEVPRDLIVEALDAACWAPNHHLTQPWRFYLVGPETKEAIAKLTRDMVTAKKGADEGQAKYERWRAIPGWIVVTSARSDDPQRTLEDYASTACTIHNLSLQLWTHGIGVKWTTGAVTRTDEFHDLLWIDPEVEQVVGLVWYGRPSETPVTARHAIDEVLVSLP
jgi:nitroreductase